MLHLIKNKIFIRLVGAFILTGFIGILIQLTAFYPMAKYLSFNTYISYNSIGLCKGSEVDTFFNNTYEKYSHEIKQNLPFPNKEKFERIDKKILKESLLIEVIAPSVIILIGSLGFMYLFNDYKKRKINNSFTLKQWVATFATFFWARNLAIAVLYGISIVLNNENLLFINETNIASFINVSPLFIIGVLGALSIIILSITVFIFIPKNQRRIFIISGIIGSPLGLLIWFKLIGPIILP